MMKIERKLSRRLLNYRVMFGLILATVVGVSSYILLNLIGVPVIQAPTLGQDSTAATIETPVTKTDIAEHRVAPDEPKTISIAAQGIFARVLPLGLTKEGAIDAPRNIYDTGWYKASSKPGKKGAVFIDGHVSSPARPGIFINIKKLKHGQEVSLATGDGTIYKYRVVSVQVVPVDKVNMEEVLSPYGGVEQGLNLMTCTGIFDSSSESFKDRAIVYTEKII